MTTLSRFELLAIAKICHQANKAYCESIGDTSQVDWEVAPNWQKESAVAGVKFHAENAYSIAADSHASWYAQKEREGWKYGPVKDVEKREHPCMVPFVELPVEQQVKDHIFRGIVHAFVHQSPLFAMRY